MGTAIKHPVPDRVKPSFVISEFDIRAFRRSELSGRVPGCQKLPSDGLTRSGTLPIWQQWPQRVKTVNDPITSSCM